MSRAAEIRAFALALAEQIEREFPDYDAAPVEAIEAHEWFSSLARRFAPSPEGWFRIVEGEVI
jgi:hypothetical protein